MKHGFRIFQGVVVTTVVAVIILGLTMVGTPGQERARQYDEQRVNELQNMANAVDAYFGRMKKLPETLSVLQNQREYYLPTIIDPRTGQSYEYRVTGVEAFELCATFETAISETDPRPAKPYVEPYPGRFWQHGVGRVCFPLTVVKPPTP